MKYETNKKKPNKDQTTSYQLATMNHRKALLFLFLIFLSVDKRDL